MRWGTGGWWGWETILFLVCHSGGAGKKQAQHAKQTKLKKEGPKKLKDTVSIESSGGRKKVTKRKRFRETCWR